jgi:pSer/pThr/pTyr-binding forkhead associated (FHA) protein
MEKNSSRMIFIMKPNNPKMEFKVGRGHDSDIRVSDISVSRYHARVKYEDGKFLLEDNTSKFGTLVQIKDKTPIKRNHTCAVQSGRTVATYMLKSTDFLRQATSRVGVPMLAGSEMQARKPMDLKEEAQNLNRLMSVVKNETTQFNNQSVRPPN